MANHIITSNTPAKATPSKALPDGMIAGNGDVTIVLSGSADRVKFNIGKADFWKADGNAYAENRGGIAPLGAIEILLPHLAYADYEAEENIDEAYIGLKLTAGKFFACMKATVCATDNIILIELEHSHPMISTSISLKIMDGSDAICKSGEIKGVSYSLRGFDADEYRFASYGVCALNEVCRSVENGVERIVWAISVVTNHDKKAYLKSAVNKARSINESKCTELFLAHKNWWKQFWAKSAVELEDKALELYWYAGIYAIACTARNKDFAPGLWGAYSTDDGMGWFGDYHLNYNYEAAFYALVSSNHQELLECYSSPLKAFLPIAEKYAEKYLGIKGAYFPVAIGPKGLETDLHPDTKEHGHLFLGQKSNGAYAAVIPMMHWYGTRDKKFAKREYYDYLVSVARFWENYIVFENGKYTIYNDALNEVEWWSGSDAMPIGHDEKNPIISLGLVKMLMKLLVDISESLGENNDRIHKWKHIVEHIPDADTFILAGDRVLRGVDGSDELRELTLDYLYPIGEIGKYSTPELFEAAKNTHRKLNLWDSNNRFCSYYPAAARLEYSEDEIISRIREVIVDHALPNGMFRFVGGGLENSAAIPMTVNEMLLQSNEGILRLFPIMKSDARFMGLRAYGAFVVDAEQKGGKIEATIVSEQGMPLTLEASCENTVLSFSDGRKVTLTEKLTTINTTAGEIIKLSGK